jgi:hypothetical protein
MLDTFDGRGQEFRTFHNLYLDREPGHHVRKLVRKSRG